MIRVAVALLLASALLLAGASSATGKRVGLVRVFARTTSETSEGRHHFVVKAVLDKRARLIGEVTQVCTDVGARQSCVGALELPLGKLVFQGTRRSARFYQFAVTGGTGIYAGSTGTYTSSTISTRGSRVEYVLASLVP